MKNLIKKIKETILKNKRSKILTSVGLILILISSVATYTYLSGVKLKNSEQVAENESQVLSAQDESYDFDEAFIENSDSLSILLLGYGGAGHSGGFLTDVIQVVHFDFKTSKIALISIPRDLWVQQPNGVSSKINQAFTLGNKSDPINSGAKVSAQMASTVTGLRIDKFISVDFVGFKRAIGYELEGIKVNVPETLDDSWYPISGREQETCGKTPEEVASLTSQYSGFELEKQFECRYEHIYFRKGINYMEGGDALSYVRSRHGSVGGDFDRSQRQQALLLAIRDRLFELEALKNIPGFFKQMIAHTNTDFDVDSIKSLAPFLLKSKDIEVVNITLSTENVLTSSKSSSGQYIITSKAGSNNWDGVRAYIQSELQK